MQDDGGTAQGLLERARRVMPGGVLGTSQVSDEVGFVPSSGSGAHVRSVEGHEWLDYTMGSGALVLGYQPAPVLEAIRAQAERLLHVYAYLNVPAIELAEVIVDAVPSADRLRFTASGAEATAYALRLARAQTGRDKVLKFEGAYHGFHDHAIHSFSRGGRAHPLATPNSAGIPASTTADVLVAGYNDLVSAQAVVDEYGDDLAAILVEPVQRIIEPEPGFLAGLHALADRCGAVLVFDEVVTGFRLGWGGAQERYGVLPDLTCLGKVIGGGLPLAAVCGTAELLDRCAPGADGYVYQSGTMNGHALAAAAGLATLRTLRDEDGFQRLEELGTALRSALTAVLDAHGAPARVVGVGSLWQVVFTREPVRSVADIWASDGAALLALHDAMVGHGVFVWRGNRSFVSTAHTLDDVRRTADVVDTILGQAGHRQGSDDVRRDAHAAAGAGLPGR